MSELLDDLIAEGMFPHVVSGYRVTTDGFGAETQGASFEVPAYVFGAARKVRSHGVTVDSSVTAVIGGFFGLTEQEIYFLPSGFVPNSPRALAVATHTDDEDGPSHPHHQTIYF